MKKMTFQKAKTLLFVLWFIMILPIVFLFGRDIGKTASYRAESAEEIFNHYTGGSHYDEWQILQILQVLRGKDQIKIGTVEECDVILDENREEILNEFLNVRIDKLTLECIAVLLIIGLAFMGMLYRRFYIPAWGIVLGIETFIAQAAAAFIVNLLRFPIWDLSELISTVVVGILLFVVLNVVDWIQIKSDFKFRFLFLRIAGCLVTGYCITLWCFFYPLRYTEDVFALTVLIPEFLVALILVLVLRTVQLRMQQHRLENNRENSIL